MFPGARVTGETRSWAQALCALALVWALTLALVPQIRPRPAQHAKTHGDSKAGQGVVDR